MFVDPKKVLEQIEILEGTNVADFGAGSGFYTKLLSEKVGPSGNVFSVELNKEISQKLAQELQGENYRNINFLISDLEKKNSLKIENEKISLVVASFMLFQINDKNSFAEEVKRVLISKGRILVIDWKDSFSGIGPNENLVFSENKALKLFETFDFKVEKKLDLGKYAYGILFRKIN